MAIPFFRGKRRELTLLFITPHRLVRADFGGADGSTLRHLWYAPAPAGELLPVLAEAAFFLGPASRADIYVIASTVATQVLTVPLPKVAGLEGEDLGRALSFEAEALSGLNPFESALGARSVGEAGGQRQYWITQIPSSELQQLDEAFARHQANLAGVLHPGGLPRHIESNAGGDPWQRVEVWNDAIFCIDAYANGSSKLHLIASSPNRANWQPEADSWFKGCGGTTAHKETLVADPLWLTETGGGHSLDEEQVLRTFLTAWARELSQPSARIPIVRPPPRPMPASTRWAIAASLAAVSALVCGAHWLLTDRRIKGLEASIRSAQVPVQLMQALRTETGELERQVTSVTAEIVSMRSLLDDWKTGVTLEHRRHATLLDSLVKNTPSTLMIESIHEKPGELRVTGVSMTAESPGFGNGIASSMEPFQWVIDPPHRRAMSLADDGGPWQLVWVLRPLPPPVPTTNAPVAPVTAQNGR